MDKFFYILTCISVFFAANCDERLDVERKSIHPEPTEEDQLRKKLCPPCICPIYSPDPCSEDEKSNPWNTQCYYAGRTMDNENPLPPRDFGNGIYFFPTTQHGFAISLSMFLKAHPELRVTTIAEDSNSERKGYFVIFNHRSISIEEEKEDEK